MKKNKLLILFLLLSSGLWAQTTEELVLTHLERAYASICDDEYYSVHHWMLGESTSDNGESLNDIPELNQMMALDLDPCNSRILGYWNRLYSIIAGANYVIHSSTGMTGEAQLIAEAKFIRSLAYFDLVKVFGPVPLYTEIMNWPILDTYSSYPDFVFKERSSISDIYTQLKTDLSTAAEDLPVKSSLTSEEIYRATSGAAKALLAKVYLFESSYAQNYPDDPRYSGLSADWNTVLSLSQEVIESGQYALAGGATYDTWWNGSYAFPDQTSGYRYIFTVEGNFGTESVFEAKRFDPEAGWLFYGDNGLTQFSSPREYFYNGGGSSMFGWGHHIPSQVLEDAFAGETGSPADDPRYSVTISSSGDSVLVSGGMWQEINFAYSATGLYTRKFECSPEQFWDLGYSWGSSPFNIRVIRIADVYLWAAEAAYQLSNTALALEYINAVRERAAGSGSTGYPQPLVSISFDDIVKERQLELAMEGHRYFDLVRWNLAEDKLDGLYNASLDMNVSYTKGVNEVFPIPSDIVYKSGGVVAQNPGYYELCPFLESFDDVCILSSVDSTLIDLEGKYSGSSFEGVNLSASIAGGAGVTSAINLQNNTLTLYYNNLQAGDIYTVSILLDDPAVTYTEEFKIFVVYTDISFDASEIKHTDRGFNFTYYTDLFFSEYEIANISYQMAVYLPDGNRFRAMYASKYANEDNTDYGVTVNTFKSDFREFAGKTDMNEFNVLCSFWESSNDEGERHSFLVPVTVSDIIHSINISEASIDGDIMTLDISTTNLIANDLAPQSPPVLFPDINILDMYITLDTTKVKFLGLSSVGTITADVDHFVSTRYTNDSTLLVRDSLSAYIYGEGDLVQLQLQLLEGTADNKIVSDFGFIRQNEEFALYDYEVILHYGEYIPLNIQTDTEQQTGIMVYPTLASDQLFIQAEFDSYNIRVFDNMGRLMLEKQGNSRNEVLNIESMPAGIYFIMVNNSELSATAKFIKQ